MISAVSSSKITFPPSTRMIRTMFSGHNDSLPVSMLLDSGADVSILSTNDFQRLVDTKMFTSLIPSGPVLQLKGFNDSECTATPYLFPSLTFKCLYIPDVVIYDVILLVATQGERSIIGIDLLTKTDLAKELFYRLTRKFEEEVTYDPLLDNLSPFCSPIISSVESPLITSSVQNVDRLNQILAKYPELFQGDMFLRRLAVEPIKVTLRSDWENSYRPQPRRNLDAAKKVAVNEEVEKLLALGIIEEIHSTIFLSNVVPVKQRDKLRICYDLTAVNKVILPNLCPLPLIEDVLHLLAGKKLFATLDLVKGFYQLPLHEDSRCLTSFYGPHNKVYQFRCIPFGLSTAPSDFQASVQTILGDCYPSRCLLYVDDIVIFGDDEEDLLINIDAVLNKLNVGGATLNMDKCSFGLSEITYLGYQVSGSTLKLKKDRFLAVEDFEKPRTVTELRSFLGCISSFRSFIPNFSKAESIISHLCATNLSAKSKIAWDEMKEQAFYFLKDSLFTAETLQLPDPREPYYIFTDASVTGTGGIICQRSKEDRSLTIFSDLDVPLSPIGIISNKNSVTERNYSVTEIETLAIIRILKKFENLLLGSKIFLYTDHRNIIFLSHCPTSKIMRWNLYLSQFLLEIKWIEGSLNNISDFLSRNNFEAESDLGGKEVYMVTRSSPASKNKDAPKSIESSESTQTLPLLIEKKNSTLHDQVIQKFHSDIAGHHGKLKTSLMIKAKGFKWHDMNLHIESFIKSCVKCQFGGRKGDKVFSDGHDIANKPWFKVHLDHLKLPMSPKSGFEYILVAVDSFSRFVELYPTKSTGTLEYLEFLMKAIYPRYGLPEVIVTDNATTFTSELSTAFSKYMGFTHKFSCPGNSADNGSVEVTNRLIVEELRKILSCRNDKSDWEPWVPIVQRILNYSYSPVIKESPARVLFGDRLSDLQGEYFPFPVDKTPSDMTMYIEILNEELKKIHMAVCEARLTDEKKRKMFANSKKSKVSEISYEIGDLFLVLRQNKGHKLESNWSGPYEVTGSTQSSVSGKNVFNNRVLLYPKKYIKPFVSSDKNYMPLKNVIEEDEYYVEDVLDHVLKNGDLNVKSLKKAKYVIKWLGYEETTIEPFENVKTCEALVRYFFKIGKSELAESLNVVLL